MHYQILVNENKLTDTNIAVYFDNPSLIFDLVIVYFS